MNNFLTSVSLTVIFVTLLMLIRSIKGEMALPLSICISVSLTGVAMAVCVPLVDYINSIAEPYSQGYLSVLMKAIGISLVTSSAVDICRDSGETAIASKVELLGKCEILVLSLPLIRDITELLLDVLEG